MFIQDDNINALYRNMRATAITIVKGKCIP